MESLKKKNVTVQGVMTPVPAVLGSEQAGSRPSSSNDRNAAPVNSLAEVADIATSTKGKEPKNNADIFRRSNKLARSPPGTPFGTPQQRALHPKASECKNDGVIVDTPTSNNLQANICTDKGVTTEDHTTSVEPTQNTPSVASKDNRASAPIAVRTESGSNISLTDSPRQELIEKMRKLEEDAISQCKVVLDGMQRATNRQKNISNDVKLGISKMAELMDVIGNYRRTWKAAEEEKALSNHRRKVAEKQIRDASTPTASNSKRAATSPAVPESSKKARAKEPSENIKGTLQPNLVEKVLPKEKEENWQTVTRKGSKRKLEKSVEPSKVNKLRPRRVKPEAVIIKPAEGHSYAEVLKGLRSKVTTDDSNKIKSVRKTMTGAILLEFDRGERINTDFVQKLKSTVKETAYIAELRQRATIEIRDLDSLTVKEEVEAAIRQLLANPEEQLQTRLTAPNMREQIRAFVTLAAESAAKLIRSGHIKVGWIRAKIRACENTRRCYRCFGTGHAQTNCPGPDRRDKCIRCGETGHKMKDCTATPKCANCTDAKLDRTDHLPGSRRCPLVKNL